MHRRSPLLIAALALAFAIDSRAEDRTPKRTPPLPPVELAKSDEDGPFSRRTPATHVAEKTRGAVVMLRAMQTIPAKLNSDDVGRTTNLGAGIVFDRRGYVVTNYHVVSQVQKIDAVLSDGRKTTARLVNYDKKADLAVLKLEGPGDYRYVSLSDGAEPMEGEWAIAIGNPYGLSNSLAWGVVSHVDRDMKLPNGEMAKHLIQVSAAINPGNSGGPLFTVNGQLLGITSAIRSNSQGIAFAITTKRVLEVVKNLMPGPISLSTMGLAIKDEDKSDRNALVEVAAVEEGSPAARAGFTAGDRIVGVGKEKIRNAFDLERAFWDRQFGDSLSFKVKDKNLPLELSIKGVGAKLTHTELVWQKLGIWALEIPGSRVRHLHDDYKGGLLVVNVAPDSHAQKSGLLTGDVVIGLMFGGSGHATVEAANITFMMRDAQYQQNTTVEVVTMRDGELLVPRPRMYFPSDRQGN
jgi:serine protease Do